MFMVQVSVLIIVRACRDGGTRLDAIGDAAATGACVNNTLIVILVMIISVTIIIIINTITIVIIIIVIYVC